MTLNEATKKLLYDSEGFVAHPYHDQAKGVVTIGLGTTYYPGGTPVTMADPNITLEQAWDILEQVAAPLMANIVALLPGLNENQYGALFDFAYNLGFGALQSSTLHRVILADDLDPEIRTEFLKWDKLHINGVLTTSSWQFQRRTKEADLYFCEV